MRGSGSRVRLQRYWLVLERDAFSAELHELLDVHEPRRPTVGAGMAGQGRFAKPSMRLEMNLALVAPPTPRPAGRTGERPTE